MPLPDPPKSRATPRTRDRPLESFGPEVMQALLLGARQELRIPLPTYREAIQLHLRLQQLRKSMQRHGHPMWSTVARTMVRTKWGVDAGLPPVAEHRNARGVRRPFDTSVPAVVIVSPHDAQFLDALKAAGVDETSLRDDTLLAEPAPDPSSPPDYLDELANSKKPPGV